MTMYIKGGLDRFLKTETAPHDLRTALRVLREFKSLESDREWSAYGFDSWARLEQFEEYLGIMCGEES